MKSASRSVRLARAKRATTKTEAYETLRSFMAQNRTNKRLLVELGGYLRILKDGGDLTDRDLTKIRKQMHRNNASDLADMFRSNPTGRQPSPRAVKQPSVTPPPPSPSLTTPRSLLAFARAFKKKLVVLFESSRSVTHTRKHDKIRTFPKLTGDKKFYQTILAIKGSDALIILIEPVDGDYSVMPQSVNVFWAGKEYNTDYVQRKLKGSGLLKTTIQDIIDFLLNEAQTTAGGFMVSRGQTVSFVKSDRKWEFMLEPGGRERQDHWHFNMDIDYEDEYSDWESEAWNDWSENYEWPLTESTQEVLKKKFPLLKANPGEWSVGVGEKGHVWFDFNKSLISA